MSFVSRFLHEDEHFAEVPGCPLRGVRAGAVNDDDNNNDDGERACARCRYNVCFVGSAEIGCHLRTPDDVVARARAVLDADTVAQWHEAHAVDDRARWKALGHRLLGIDDDDVREVASVILRFAGADERLGPVEVLR